jgi:hypothetical protein
MLSTVDLAVGDFASRAADVSHDAKAAANPRRAISSTRRIYDLWMK